MSFIVAGCMLLLALFLGIVVDSVGVTRGGKTRRHLPSFDAWGTQGPMDDPGLAVDRPPSPPAFAASAAAAALRRNLGSF
jgi:hypothetical protein